MKTFILLFAIASVASGQDAKAPEVVSGVPADIFNYFAWASGVIIVGLVGGIIALFKKQGKTGLSAEEHEWIRWLKEVHDTRDQDGVLTWNVPRIWGKLIEETNNLAKKQVLIDDIRDRLDKEQIERREQVEELLREQKDIMQAALEMSLKVGLALDNNNKVLDNVEILLQEQE